MVSLPGQFEVGCLYSPLVHLSILAFSCFICVHARSCPSIRPSKGLSHLIQTRIKHPISDEIPQSFPTSGCFFLVIPKCFVSLPQILRFNVGPVGYPWRRNRCYRRNLKPQPCVASCRPGPSRVVFHGETNWGFPEMGGTQNGGFTMENPIKKDDLGVPLFYETSN